MRPLPLFVLLFCCASACVTARPTAFDVPPERSTECTQICTKLGMNLSAVVVIMNAAGCVCVPTAAQPGAPAASEGGAAAAGGAAIAAMRAAEQQAHPPSH